MPGVPHRPRVLEASGPLGRRKYCKIQVRRPLGEGRDLYGPLRVRVCFAEASRTPWGALLRELEGTLVRHAVIAGPEKRDAARRIPVRCAKAAAPRQSLNMSWPVFGTLGSILR